MEELIDMVLYLENIYLNFCTSLISKSFRYKQVMDITTEFKSSVFLKDKFHDYSQSIETVYTHSTIENQETSTEYSNRSIEDNYNSIEMKDEFGYCSLNNSDSDNADNYKDSNFTNISKPKNLNKTYENLGNRARIHNSDRSINESNRSFKTKNSLSSFLARSESSKPNSIQDRDLYNSGRYESQDSFAIKPKKYTDYGLKQNTRNSNISGRNLFLTQQVGGLHNKKVNTDIHNRPNLSGYLNRSLSQGLRRSSTSSIILNNDRYNLLSKNNHLSDMRYSQSDYSNKNNYSHGYSNKTISKLSNSKSDFGLGKTINTPEKKMIFKMSSLFQNGSISMNAIEYLLQNTSINARDIDTGETLLDYACKKGDCSLMNFCYRKKADLTSPGPHGKTPLTIAIANKCYDVVERLVQYGVSINSGDANGRTAMHIAVEKEQLDGICRLVELGANVSMKDSLWCTPLHSACREGNKKALNILLQFGADINARDIDGKTPAAYAEANNNFKLMDRLIMLGGINEHCLPESSNVDINVKELSIVLPSAWKRCL